MREWDSFARALDALGHTETAITLAHDALREALKQRRVGTYDSDAKTRASLAEWLATRAEEVGEHAIALEAMRVAVEDAPTLEKYLRLEQLAGAQWAQIRPKVLRHIGDSFVHEEIAAIYIHEGMYADALAILCESYALAPALRDRLSTMNLHRLARYALKRRTKSS